MFKLTELAKFGGIDGFAATIKPQPDVNGYPIFTHIYPYMCAASTIFAADYKLDINCVIPTYPKLSANMLNTPFVRATCGAIMRRQTNDVIYHITDTEDMLAGALIFLLSKGKRCDWETELVDNLIFSMRLLGPVRSNTLAFVVARGSKKIDDILELIHYDVGNRIDADSRIELFYDIFDVEATRPSCFAPEYIYQLKDPTILFGEINKNHKFMIPNLVMYSNLATAMGIEVGDLRQWVVISIEKILSNGQNILNLITRIHQEMVLEECTEANTKIWENEKKNMFNYIIANIHRGDFNFEVVEAIHNGFEVCPEIPAWIPCDVVVPVHLQRATPVEVANVIVKYISDQADNNASSQQMITIMRIILKRNLSLK